MKNQEIREKSIKIRLTETEYNELTRKAQERNIPISTYARNAIFDPESISPLYSKTIRHFMQKVDYLHIKMHRLPSAIQEEINVKDFDEEVIKVWRFLK